jgi:hypothetical protein
MFEERAIRRIFGPKREAVTGDCPKSNGEWLHYLYPSPNIVSALKERWWDRVVVCHGGVRGNMSVGFCWGNVKETDVLEDIDWDGRQRLKWISNIQNETVWTFINCLRIGTSKGLLWAWQLIFTSHKRAISRLDEELLVSKVRYCSMELVTQLVN